MRKIVIVILLIVAVVSCTNIDCPVQNSVMTTYGLRKSGSGEVDTMGIDTMWVRLKRVDHTDTLLINRLWGAKATNFQIPISYTQPEDSICTTVVDTIGTVWRDTIVIKKDNMPHFESVDCQASYFHTLTAVKSTHYLIDTVVINHSFVSYDTSNEHLLLYLKARR